MLTEYKTESFYDEMFLESGQIRPSYRLFKEKMDFLSTEELRRRKSTAERSYFNRGITFQVYGDPADQERIIPFDIIPRIIRSDEWSSIERGLKQRIMALNLFITDIYNEKKILKDGVVPEEAVYSSSGYLPQCEGVVPPRGVWVHITGVDLVRDGEGVFRVLEDNLRCPSGVSYVLENREILQRTLPELSDRLSIRPILDYPQRLRNMLASFSTMSDAGMAVMTPGPFNSAYYEHSFLARKMGISLVEGPDLIVRDDRLFMKTTKGLKPIDVIYRRIDDRFLDPEAFRPDSILGVKGIFELWKKGRITLANAPGAGVADDKAIYAFVPDIIRYYLNEEPILANVPTYLCYREKDLAYVLEHISELVVKTTDGAGGYGMLIGPQASAAEIADFKEKVKSDPKHYIAQPVLALSRIPTLVDGGLEGRHVDFRPYILYGDDIYVMPGGLTRVALRRGSLVVNSSQGGGTKDTWVISGDMAC